MIKKYIVKGSKPIGDSHRYTSKKGEISLIYPETYTFMTYEIFCIKENLFEDIERYETFELAEKRIKELLL